MPPKAPMPPMPEAAPMPQAAPMPPGAPPGSSLISKDDIMNVAPPMNDFANMILPVLKELNAMIASGKPIDVNYLKKKLQPSMMIMRNKLIPQLQYSPITMKLQPLMNALPPPLMAELFTLFNNISN
ncbi:MAG: hypothetical protein EBU66_05470 [Bacteroidetes bacterium]|nr:hypothetical protein [Bacteroidota bacterium]